MMNNFTKQELQYIAKSIYERPNFVTKQMEEMRNKVESMIDNYCEHDIPVTIDDALKNINALINVQSYHGNYDCDPYMFGLANGLILARSCIDGKDPEFLTKPEKWIEDMPKTRLIDECVCHE